MVSLPNNECLIIWLWFDIEIFIKWQQSAADDLNLSVSELCIASQSSDKGWSLFSDDRTA